MGHGYLLNHSHVYHTIFVFLCKHFFVIFFTVIFPFIYKCLHEKIYKVIYYHLYDTPDYSTLSNVSYALISFFFE